MLTIEKNIDGTIEVWHHEVEPKLNVRVCTHPDKLATTLPRGELKMVRKLVDELDELLPKGSELLWTEVPGQTVIKNSDGSLAYNNPSSAADGRLERV